MGSKALICLMLILLTVSVSSMSTTYSDMTVTGNFFAQNATFWDLIVESGNSICLANACFENEGTFTSVDTDFGIHEDNEPTAFLGVYAHNDSIWTEANIILEAGIEGSQSVFNLLKNSPLHPFSPNSSAIINEGNFGTFVEHDDVITWWHFENLTKDEHGNVLYLNGMQRLMELNDSDLFLEEVNLIVNGTITADSLNVVGLINSYIGLDVPELYNSLGTLKIQPDVQGDVALFTDTDIADPDNGRRFYVHRKAAEGDENVQLFINGGGNAIMLATSKLTLQAPALVTVQSNNQNIVLKVGDTGGEYGIRFKDSANSDVARIGSDGTIFKESALYNNVKTFQFDPSSVANIYTQYLGTFNTENGVVNIDIEDSGGWHGVSTHLEVRRVNSANPASPATTAYQSTSGSKGYKIYSRVIDADTYELFFEDLQTIGGTIDYTVYITTQGLIESDTISAENDIDIIQNNIGITIDDDGNLVVGTTTSLGYEFNLNGSANIDKELIVGGDNLFVDYTTGRVGIGTTEPDEKLTVEGNIKANRGTQNNIRLEMDSGGTYIKYGGSKLINQIGTFINSSFSIMSNSTERITIDKDGFIGINITSPEYQLDIDGTGEYLLSLKSSMGYALGSGTGILFGGRYNNGPSIGNAASIDVEKNNGVNGDSGFDLVFYTHPNYGSPLIERFRLYSEGGADIAGVILEGDNVSNNYLGALLPGSLTDGAGNNVFGNNSLRNIDEASGNSIFGDGSGGGITDGTGNVIFGTGSGVSSMDDNNIIIGSYLSPPTGLTSNSLNLAGVIQAAIGSGAVKIGGSGSINITITLEVDGDLKVTDLSGSGNDYVCVDSTGKLFRSNSAC